MKIADDAVIRDHYDVVVVGAGIGGLTAAALLAKRGLKVLVLEQHYIPGGVCTAIRRKDIVMDVGAAMLFGWGESGYNPHRFVMNELEEDIEMIPHQSIYRIHLEDGRTVTFWRDMDRYLDELIQAFPHQARGIRGVYAELKDFYDSVMKSNNLPVPPTEVPPKEGVKLFLKNPGGVMKLLKYWFKTEEDILKKYITDPKLMGFFDFMTATFTCCNVSESPSLLGVTMFIENHVGGACYPSGSPQMLPNKLEKAIEKFGGQVVYRKMVDEILIWQGRAYGVRLADGTEIAAGNVVSNASVWNLYGKLVKPRHIKPERMKWAQSFEPTLGTMLLYMGVRAEAIPEDTRPIEMFIENIFDFSAPNYCAFIPSLDDPSIAPPGTHSVTVIAPTKLKWPRPDEWFYQSEQYNRLKQEQAETVIERMQNRYFSKLKENIITLDVGTPSTLERYALKPWGNVGGPKLTMKQGFMNRLKARSEWKNLYCVGDSTTMGEGVIATTVSGVGAANRLLEDAGLPIYLPRPFSRQYVHLIKGKPWTPSPPVDVPISEETAKRIARDCQHCEKPECRAACPAGIDTCSFARRIEAGNFVGAARVLRDVNPLSEICGYICPSERLCEKHCSRLEFDTRAVRVRELHGWVCGRVRGPEGWDRFVPARNGKKVAVVGAGPAGLTCAHFLARVGFEIDIFDKGEKPGGMLSHAVPTFRLPEEVLEGELSGVVVPGMRFHFGKALGKDVSVAELEERYDAVFLAPGLWAGRGLKIPGGGGQRVVDALTFLSSCRKGGDIEVGKKTVVIGGGSVAADVALSALMRGAETVTLVCLEKEEEMPALPSEVKELKKRGVRILDGWGPKEFLTASLLSCVRCTAVYDGEGRLSPAYDESRRMEVECDQVVLAVGQCVDQELSSILEKEFGRHDLIEVEGQSMRVKGRTKVYAGGDIVRGAGTAVHAVADGRRAAQAISAGRIR
jgi:carotene isomerase